MDQTEITGITKDNVNDQKIIQYIDCFDESNGQFKCLVAGCTSILKHNSTSIRHLKKKHAEIKEAIDVNRSDFSRNGVVIRIQSTPLQIWNAILQLVIFSALPLCIVQAQGFQCLLKPFVTAFKSIGIDFSVNRYTIRAQISERAKRIKETITNEVKGIMICLLLDIASRFNRSIFGINIVFYANGKNHTRTIGMHTLKVSQTGQNLFDIVKNTLDDFEITLDQVFAVTTDNGKNLIKLAKIMGGSLADETDNEQESDGDEDETEDLVLDSAVPHDEIFDPEDFNDDYFSDLLANLKDAFPDTMYNGLFTGINCAAHCLNLVIQDGLKMSPHLNDLIEKSRTLVKKLRTPSMRGALRAKSMKMALLDVKTRWSSLFNMVNLIFSL